MASSYSELKVELIGTGEQVGTWGSTTNTNFSTALGEAIAGSADVTFASADVDITLTDTNATQTARNYRLNLTGTSGGARNLYLVGLGLGTGANIKKPYIINNGLADDVTVRNKDNTGPVGTSVTIPAGRSMLVYNTGTNIVDVQNYTAVSSGGTGRSTLTANNVILGNGTSPVQFVAPGSSGSVLRSNGTTWESGGVPAGGSNTQVQFNASGSLTGASSFTFNSATGTVTATTFNGALTGNASTATSATTATTATSATTASNVAGGAANRIVYNTGSGSTSFITAPTTPTTYLQWDGSAFTWASVGGGGAVSSVSGSGAGINVSPTTGAVVVSNTGVTSFNSRTSAVTLSSGDVTGALGYTPYNGSTNPNGFVTSSALSGYATLSGSNSWTNANTFSGGLTSNSFNMSSATSMYGASLSGGQYFAIRFDINSSTLFQLIPGGNYCYTNYYPSSDNSYTLGGSGQRWSAVWAANGTIQTSDNRLKKDVANSQLGLSFINKLRPVSYKWIIGENVEDGYIEEDVTDIQGNVIRKTKVPKHVARPGTRTHYGFISQEVKAAIDQEAVGDFGGWVLSDKNDPNSEQCLRYDQFISPLVKAVQELSAQVQTLQAEVAALKGA